MDGVADTTINDGRKRRSPTQPKKKNISLLLGLSSYHNHIHCIEYCIKVCFVCFCSYVVEYDNSRAAEEEE